VLLAEERRLSGLRTELSSKAEIAAQTLAAKERQVEERLTTAAGNNEVLSIIDMQTHVVVGDLHSSADSV
jgi:hypothetical protein